MDVFLVDLSILLSVSATEVSKSIIYHASRCRSWKVFFCSVRNPYNKFESTRVFDSVSIQAYKEIQKTLTQYIQRRELSCSKKLGLSAVNGDYSLLLHLVSKLIPEIHGSSNDSSVVYIFTSFLMSMKDKKIDSEDSKKFEWLNRIGEEKNFNVCFIHLCDQLKVDIRSIISKLAFLGESKRVFHIQDSSTVLFPSFTADKQATRQSFSFPRGFECNYRYTETSKFKLVGFSLTNSINLKSSNKSIIVSATPTKIIYGDHEIGSLCMFRYLIMNELVAMIEKLDATDQNIYVWLPISANTREIAVYVINHDFLSFSRSKKNMHSNSQRMRIQGFDECCRRDKHWFEKRSTILTKRESLLLKITTRIDIISDQTHGKVSISRIDKTHYIKPADLYNQVLELRISIREFFNHAMRTSHSSFYPYKALLRSSTDINHHYKKEFKLVDSKSRVSLMKQRILEIEIQIVLRLILYTRCQDTDIIDPVSKDKLSTLRDLMMQLSLYLVIDMCDTQHITSFIHFFNELASSIPGSLLPKTFRKLRKKLEIADPVAPNNEITAYPIIERTIASNNADKAYIRSPNMFQACSKSILREISYQKNLNREPKRSLKCDSRLLRVKTELQFNSIRLRSNLSNQETYTGFSNMHEQFPKEKGRTRNLRVIVKGSPLKPPSSIQSPPRKRRNIVIKQTPTKGD